jgi:WXG100 family type VII secretion target
MAYTIRLTPPELREKANSIDDNAKIVEKEVGEIKAQVNLLRPTFLGETAAAFFKEFDAACQDMEKWDDIVRSFSVEIREAANRLQAADQSHG